MQPVSLAECELPDFDPAADVVIDPLTWRLVQLKWDYGADGWVRAWLLRGPDWLSTYAPVAGESLTLELPEMGCVGSAEVVSVELCPELEEGPGRLVTGFFEHSSGVVYDLTLVGSAERLGITGTHPVWSEDRQGWVSAAELEPGERVRTLNGPRAVESLIPRAKPERVYNIEVDANHVYRVGAQGLLVHNMSVGPNPIPKAEGEREVADIRVQFGIDPDENVAYGEVNVGSYQDELIGVSGRDSPAGTVPTPGARLFDPFDTPPGHYRGNDAEVKLLEAIAKAIQPHAKKGQCYSAHTGSIRLYSDFTICPSCGGVIEAFQTMFPNIEFSYSDGE